ncbi:MAG: tetratricopeptide repeat protein, partial [Candidatus Omnitrophota bacterium]
EGIDADKKLLHTFWRKHIKTIYQLLCERREYLRNTEVSWFTSIVSNTVIEEKHGPKWNLDKIGTRINAIMAQRGITWENLEQRTKFSSKHVKEIVNRPFNPERTDINTLAQLIAVLGNGLTAPLAKQMFNKLVGYNLKEWNVVVKTNAELQLSQCDDEAEEKTLIKDCLKIEMYDIAECILKQAFKINHKKDTQNNLTLKHIYDLTHQDNILLKDEGQFGPVLWILILEGYPFCSKEGIISVNDIDSGIFYGLNNRDEKVLEQAWRILGNIVRNKYLGKDEVKKCSDALEKVSESNLKNNNAQRLLSILQEKYLSILPAYSSPLLTIVKKGKLLFSKYLLNPALILATSSSCKSLGIKCSVPGTLINPLQPTISYIEQKAKVRVFMVRVEEALAARELKALRSINPTTGPPDRNADGFYNINSLNKIYNSAEYGLLFKEEFCLYIEKGIEKGAFLFLLQCERYSQSLNNINGRGAGGVRGVFFERNIYTDSQKDSLVILCQFFQDKFLQEAVEGYGFTVGKALEDLLLLFSQFNYCFMPGFGKFKFNKLSLGEVFCRIVVIPKSYRLSIILKLRNSRDFLSHYLPSEFFYGFFNNGRGNEKTAGFVKKIESFFSFFEGNPFFVEGIGKYSYCSMNLNIQVFTSISIVKIIGENYRRSGFISKIKHIFFSLMQFKIFRGFFNFRNIFFRTGNYLKVLPSTNLFGKSLITNTNFRDNTNRGIERGEPFKNSYIVNLGQMDKRAGINDKRCHGLVPTLCPYKLLYPDVQRVSPSQARQAVLLSCGKFSYIDTVLIYHQSTSWIGQAQLLQLLPVQAFHGETLPLPAVYQLLYFSFKFSLLNLFFNQISSIKYKIFPLKSQGYSINALRLISPTKINSPPGTFSLILDVLPAACRLLYFSSPDVLLVTCCVGRVSSCKKRKDWRLDNALWYGPKKQILNLKKAIVYETRKKKPEPKRPNTDSAYIKKVILCSEAGSVEPDLDDIVGTTKEAAGVLGVGMKRRMLRKASRYLKSAESNFTAGNIEQAKGDFKEALRVTQDIPYTPGGGKQLLYGQFKHIYIQLGFSEEDISSFRPGIQESIERGNNGDFFGLYYNQGCELAGLGRYEESIQEFSKSQQLACNRFQRFSVCFQLGNAQFYLGQYSKAVSNFSEALNLTNSNTLRVSICSFRAKAYFRLGCYSKAVSDFVQICKLGYFSDSGFKYGLADKDKEKTTLKGVLFSVFKENGIDTVTADKLSRNLALLKNGSLELLSIMAVITEKEKDIITDRDIRNLYILLKEWKEAEQKDFAAGFKQLLESYNREFNPEQVDILMEFLIPLEVINLLAKELSSSQEGVLSLMLKHPDFPLHFSEVGGKISSPVSKAPAAQVLRGFQSFIQQNCACDDCKYIMAKVNESINRVLPEFAPKGAFAQDTQLVIFRPKKNKLSGIGFKAGDNSDMIALVNSSQEKAALNFNISQELLNGDRYVLTFVLSGEKREKTLIAVKEEVENLLKSVEFKAKTAVVLSFKPAVVEGNSIFIGDKFYPVGLESALPDNSVSIELFLPQAYGGLERYLKKFCIKEFNFVEKNCKLGDILSFIQKRLDVFVKKLKKENLETAAEIFFPDKENIADFVRVCRGLDKEDIYLRWMVEIIKAIVTGLDFIYGKKGVEIYEKVSNIKRREIAGFYAFLAGLACIGAYFRLGGAQTLEDSDIKDCKIRAQKDLGQSINFLGQRVVREIKAVQKYFAEKNKPAREHCLEKAVIPQLKQARFLEEDNAGKIEQFRAEVNIPEQVIQDAISGMNRERYYSGFNIYWDKGVFINDHYLSKVLAKSCIFCFPVNLTQASFENIKMLRILYGYIKNFLSKYLKNEIYIVYAKLGTVESKQGLLFILGEWLAQLSNAGEKINSIQSLAQAVLPEDIIIDVIPASREAYIDLPENKEETGVEKLQKIFNEVCFPKRIEYEFIREFFFKLGELRAKPGFGEFTSLRKLSSKLIVFFAGLPENKFKDICFGDLDLEENVICLPVRVDE